MVARPSSPRYKKKNRQGNTFCDLTDALMSYDLTMKALARLQFLIKISVTNYLWVNESIAHWHVQYMSTTVSLAARWRCELCGSYHRRPDAIWGISGTCDSWFDGLWRLRCNLRSHQGRCRRTAGFCSQCNVVYYIFFIPVHRFSQVIRKNLKTCHGLEKQSWEECISWWQHLENNDYLYHLVPITFNNINQSAESISSSPENFCMMTFIKNIMIMILLMSRFQMIMIILMIFTANNNITIAEHSSLPEEPKLLAQQLGIPQLKAPSAPHWSRTSALTFAGREGWPSPGSQTSSRPWQNSEQWHHPHNQITVWPSVQGMQLSWRRLWLNNGLRKVNTKQKWRSWWQNIMRSTTNEAWREAVSPPTLPIKTAQQRGYVLLRSPCPLMSLNRKPLTGVGWKNMSVFFKTVLNSKKM